MYGNKRQAIWIFLLCTLLITSSKLLLGQVPAEAPKPATFTAATEIQASPYGHLNFSIPLISVPGSNVFTYNFDLSYQSGISYYEKENVTGVGWNFPQFQIRRTVRGYPDELPYEILGYKVGNAITSRYMRAGRFGWLDFRNYFETEGLQNNGFLGADGILPEFMVGSISEVEDSYELISPVGSGNLVYHHFEVVNPDFPIEGDFIINQNYVEDYKFGRQTLSSNSSGYIPPHYKIHFYLEKYQGIKIIFHIQKKINWTTLDNLNKFYEPNTWWELVDTKGTIYIYGKSPNTPYSLPSGSNNYYWKNDITSVSWIGTPSGYLSAAPDGTVSNRLPISSSIWGISYIYNPDYPEDYIRFQYLYKELVGDNAPTPGRKSYARENNESVLTGYKYLNPGEYTPEHVIKRGIYGTVNAPYVRVVETNTHLLEFDYGYELGYNTNFGLPRYIQVQNTIPYFRLHNLFLKSKREDKYVKQIHFTYTDGYNLRLYDDESLGDLAFDSGFNLNDKNRQKVFLDSVQQYDLDITNWRINNYNYIKTRNVPDYIFEYNKWDSGMVVPKSDVWGFNQGDTVWNPCFPGAESDENTLKLYMTIDSSSKVYYHEYLNRDKAGQFGGLPDLNYYSGKPSSALWSLRKAIYPTGIKKTFYYSPSGVFTGGSHPDIGYYDNSPPGNAQALFEHNVIPNQQSSGIFNYAEYPSSDEPDLSNHDMIQGISLTKTIGGPPLLVQIETDNGGKKTYDKFQYLQSTATHVPYTIIDDGTAGSAVVTAITNKRSLFSRYFPYPDVPRFISTEFTEFQGVKLTVYDSSSTVYTDTINTQDSVYEDIIVTGISTGLSQKPKWPQPFVFFVDPENPSSTAIRTASYNNSEVSEWNAHNLIHYNQILSWKSSNISHEYNKPPLLGDETQQTLLQGVLKIEYSDQNDEGLNSGKELLPVKITAYKDTAMSVITYQKEYEYEMLNPYGETEYGQVAFKNRNSSSRYFSTFINGVDVNGPFSINSAAVRERPVRSLRLKSEINTLDSVVYKINYYYDGDMAPVDYVYYPYNCISCENTDTFKLSRNPADIVTEMKLKTLNVGTGGQYTEQTFNDYVIEKTRPFVGMNGDPFYSTYESNFISGIAEKSIHRGDGTMEEITFYDYEVPEGKTIAKLNTTRSGTGQSELITEEVVARNNQGNIIKLKRAGVGVEYIYANSTEYAGNPGIDLENSSQPVAEIINARLYGTDAEASYCGFELNPENQSGNFEGGWTSTASTIIVSSDKYTGRHGAEIGASGESNGISKVLTPGWGNVNRQVVFSCRIKTSLDGGGRAYMKLQPNGEGCSCYLNKTEQVTIVHSPGIWQYFKIFIPVEGLCSINHNFIAVVYHDGVNDSNIIVDDLRLYPADAAMTTTTYEPRYLQTESITKEDGFTVFYSYDAAGRISFIKDQDFKLIAGYEYEYSRLTNTNGTYDTLIPNNTTTELYMTEQGSIIQTQKTYMDAAGNTLQSISNFGNQPHIAEHEITQLDDEPQSFSVMHKEFDLLNRPEKEYNPIRQYNGFGYQTNVPVLSSAHVENLYSPGDNNHLFITKKYGRDPLGRLTEIVPQGLNYSTGNHSIHYNYSNEILSGIKYNKTKVTDENGNITESLTDVAGNTIKIRRLGQGENPPQIENDFTYNSAGKITQVKDGELKTTSYTYNNAGQLMTRSTPDNGLTENIYDMHGRVRFTRDENHRGNISSIDIDKLLEPREDERLDTYGNFSTDGRSRIKITMNLDFEFGGYGSQPEESYARVIISTASGAEIISLYGDAYDEQITKEITLPAGNYEYYFEAYLEPNVAVVSFYAGLQITCANKLDFIYKKYDKAGRVTEEGEYVLSSEENHFTKEKANDAAFPTTSKVPVREYIYDKGYIIGQANLQGKLSLIVSRDVHGEVKTRTYYSYDNKGRTEWIEEEVAGQRRQIKYTYDFHGRIIKKASMASGGGGDNLYTFYEYDRQGRVQNVYTGTQLNGSNKKREADYQYFADNSVRRLALGQIGENAVQGLDYRYNSRGWLRQINHQNLNNVYLGQPQDPGGDPNDVFGMVLGYDSQDHIAALHGVPAQYNGNISWIMYNMKNVITDTTSIVGYSFKYDPFNRLVAGDFGKYSLNAQMWLETPKFDEKDIQYDKAGNILELKRFGYNGQLMDNLIFNNGSFSSNNRLSTISDNISSGSYSNDIDNQPAGNYSYDGNGNVIRDQEKDVSFIIYNIYNLPEFIAKNDNSVIQYYYNAQGNRNYKLISGNITRYYYGLNGECDSVTDNGSLLFWNINIGNENIGKVSK